MQKKKNTFKQNNERLKRLIFYFWTELWDILATYFVQCVLFIARWMARRKKHIIWFLTSFLIPVIPYVLHNLMDIRWREFVADPVYLMLWPSIITLCFAAFILASNKTLELKRLLNDVQRLMVNIYTNEHKRQLKKIFTSATFLLGLGTWSIIVYGIFRLNAETSAIDLEGFGFHSRLRAILFLSVTVSTIIWATALQIFSENAESESLKYGLKKHIKRGCY